MEERENYMITYGSTTLTSYNTITKIEVYYYKSTSATSLSGGSWSTTKPTWENGKYIWQKIRTMYEGKLDNGSYYSESDPVNITGQQGATGTSAYSYKLNASDTVVSISKNGIYSTNNIIFSATYKQGTEAISAYTGRFKIETTADGATWTTQYTSSADESSKKITLPENILVIRCSLYQAGGTTVLLDIVSVPIVKDGIDGALYPNLAPFFSHDLTDIYDVETNPNGYWMENGSSYGWTKNSKFTFIQLEDGWLHVHIDNSSGTSLIRNDCCVPRYNPSIKKGAMYTFLAEFRNNQSTGIDANSNFYLVQQSGSVQFWGTNTATAPSVKLDGIGGLSTRVIDIPSDGSYAFSRGTKYSEPDGDSSHWTTEDKMLTFTFRANAGAVIDYDVRLSVYEGEYWGGYVPYIISDVTDIRKSAEMANNKIDNLEIGGRNLFRTEPKKYVPTDYSAYEFTLTEPLEINQTYTIQLWNVDVSHSAKTEDQLGINVYYCGGSVTFGGFIGTDYFTNGHADHLTLTFTPTEGNITHSNVVNAKIKFIRLYNSYPSVDGIRNMSVEKWKLEKGNKATDWTPAPEDVEEEIATLRTDLQSQIDEKIQTFYQSTNPALSWTTTELKTAHDGDLWYYTGTTTSTYTKDNVYRYNASNNTWLVYSASGELFDKVDGKSTIYYGTTSDSYTDVEIGDYLIDSTDGSSYRYDGTKWVKVTDYQTAINNLEIGGRNLIIGTLNPDARGGGIYRPHLPGQIVNTTGRGTCTVAEHGLRFTLTEADWCYLYFGASGNSAAPSMLGLTAGETYTLSADLSWKILSSDTGKANTTTYYMSGLLMYSTAENLTTWTTAKFEEQFPITQTDKGTDMSGRLVFTFTVPEDAVRLYLGIRANNTTASHYAIGDYIEARNMKLEKGSKATDWSPAPEDIENLATAVYGTCSTAATTPLKEVVCENFILFDGVRIQVTFENANSTNVPSINVNNTGAKQILINQATVSESNQLLWAENAQMEFVYDGTYWVLQNAPYSLYGICSVTEEIPAKVIECVGAVICKGTTITVDFMYSNTSDNTVFNVANIAQKPLLVNGDTLKVNSRFNWHAGAVRTFYFDGQAWNMSDDIVSAYIDEYETDQNENGIIVHPVGQSNTGWSIGSTLELLKNGISYIKMWFDKVEEGEFSLPFIRIGKESGNHVLVGDDAVTIREDQKELAHYSSFGITFDDETPYKIGNDTTYIAFEDTDNDAKADSLRIVADSISFHSNGTEKDLQSELESLTENVDLNAQAIEQNSEIIENTQRYIQINPEVPSIKLATNDRNYLLIESNKLGFWVDANETAYMSQNQMNIPTASITNLLMQTTNAETGESIGQIGWVMRTNGHLSLKIMN